MTMLTRLAIGAAVLPRNESYFTLVWRRFRRSITGMIGLVLVSLLLLMRYLRISSHRWTRKQPTWLSRRQTHQLLTTRMAFTLRPVTYPIAESTSSIPVTFQPLIGPDYDNPRPLGFFVRAIPISVLGLIPAETHFFGTDDGTAFHLLGTDKFGRDIFSRGVIGSRISLLIALTTVTLALPSSAPASA